MGEIIWTFSSGVGDVREWRRVGLIRSSLTGILPVSSTGGGSVVRVQELRCEPDGVPSYTVLGDDHRAIAPVEEHLAYLSDVNYSPNTVKAYAHDLADFFRWLAQVHRDWRSVELADVGQWAAWLRLPAAARAGAVVVLPSVAAAVSEKSIQCRCSLEAGERRSGYSRARVAGSGWPTSKSRPTTSN
jgi:hypothetical protein